LDIGIVELAFEPARRLRGATLRRQHAGMAASAASAHIFIPIAPVRILAPSTENVTGFSR
ncbi:hypothetical protein, partial [Escherichia coli]|uniref:hypothetical protein n=1 Tax=Escherichia coli TaxID=562 RepID=UPI001954ABD8